MNVAQILARLAACADTDARLAYLRSLSAEERDALSVHLAAEFNELRPRATSTDDVAALRLNIASRAELTTILEEAPVVEDASDDEDEDPIAAALAELDELNADLAEEDAETEPEVEPEPAAAEVTEPEVTEPEPVPATSGALSANDIAAVVRATVEPLVSALRQQAPAATEPADGRSRRPSRPALAARLRSEARPPTEVGRLTVLPNVAGVQAGSEITSEDGMLDVLRQARSTYHSMNGGNRAIAGPRQYLPVVQYEAPAPRFAIGDRDTPEQVTATLTAAFEDWNQRLDARLAAFDPSRVSDQEVMASGGPCADPEQASYAVEFLSARATPFTDALPRVLFPRMQRNYRRPFSYGDVRDGYLVDGDDVAVDFDVATGTITQAMDEANYVSQGGTTPDKTCLHIPCLDDVLLCDLDEIKTCYTIGRWVDQAWPEWVQVWKNVLSVHRDEHVERHNMAAAFSSSKMVHMVGNAEEFGSNRDLYRDITRLLAHVRSWSRLGIGTGVRWHWALPQWAPLALKHAMVTAENIDPRNVLQISTAQMLSYYANEGLNISFYVDETRTLQLPDGTEVLADLGVDMVLAKPTAGTIPRLPERMRTFLWMEGTVINGVGRDINIGQYLDGDLIGTNDYGVFTAQFMKPCYIGPNAGLYVIDHELSYYDVAAAPIDVAIAS